MGQRIQISRVIIGLILFSIFTYFATGIMHYFGIACCLFFAYNVYAQYKMLFSPTPILRTDAAGIYYLGKPVIPWSKIASIKLVRASDTNLEKTATVAVNASSTLAGVPVYFRKDKLHNPSVERELKKIQYLLINFKDNSTVLKENKLEKIWGEGDKYLNGGDLTINTGAMDCDPEWLITELQQELKKYQ